jgi:hypothetical protein
MNAAFKDLVLPAALEEIGGRFQPRERLPLIVADVKTPLRVSEQTEHVACAAYIAMCEGSPPSSVGRRIARRVRMFAASKCIWRSSGSAFQPSTLPSRRRPSSGIAPATAATSTRLNACSCLGDVTRAPGTTILSESKPRRGSGRAFDRRRCCQPPTRQRCLSRRRQSGRKVVRICWRIFGPACPLSRSHPARSSTSLQSGLRSPTGAGPRAIVVNVGEAVGVEPNADLGRYPSRTIALGPRSPTSAFGILPVHDRRDLHAPRREPPTSASVPERFQTSRGSPELESTGPVPPPAQRPAP